MVRILLLPRSPDFDDRKLLEASMSRLSSETETSVLEALILAEDVLSRSPFSTDIWPNGMHPNTGIKKIRDAIKSLSISSTVRECEFPKCSCPGGPLDPVCAVSYPDRSSK
jgi:hypothetical protein